MAARRIRSVSSNSSLTPHPLHFTSPMKAPTSFSYRTTGRLHGKARLFWIRFSSTWLWSKCLLQRFRRRSTPIPVRYCFPFVIGPTNDETLLSDLVSRADSQFLHGSGPDGTSRRGDHCRLQSRTQCKYLPHHS